MATLARRNRISARRNRTSTRTSLGESAQRKLDKLRRNTCAELSFRGDLLGVEGAKELSEILKENISLRKLILDDNKIGNTGARALSEALRINTTMKELSLFNNGIDDRGMIPLGDALRQNNTLRRINLVKNEIGNNGARALSETLRYNTAIYRINLGDNKIGDEGAAAVSAALRRNHTLQVFYLNNNQIGNTGARALSTCLQENNTVHALGLADNCITNDGAAALGQLLMNNTSLRWVDLENNQMDDEGISALTQALRISNTTIMDLAVSGTRLQRMEIQSLCKRNKRGEAPSEPSEDAGRDLIVELSRLTDLERKVSLLRSKVVSVDDECPDLYKCPISLELMTDPVVMKDGYTYEKSSISTWLKQSKRSPQTNQPIWSTAMIPNKSLKSAIFSWVDAKIQEYDL